MPGAASDVPQSVRHARPTAMVFRMFLFILQPTFPGFLPLRERKAGSLEVSDKVVSELSSQF